jgi:hypothetical protein
MAVVCCCSLLLSSSPVLQMTVLLGVGTSAAPRRHASSRCSRSQALLHHHWHTRGGLQRGMRGWMGAGGGRAQQHRFNSTCAECAGTAPCRKQQQQMAADAQPPAPHTCVPTAFSALMCCAVLCCAACRRGAPLPSRMASQPTACWRTLRTPATRRSTSARVGGQAGGWMCGRVQACARDRA